MISATTEIKHQKKFSFEGLLRKIPMFCRKAKVSYEIAITQGLGTGSLKGTFLSNSLWYVPVQKLEDTIYNHIVSNLEGAIIEFGTDGKYKFKIVYHGANPNQPHELKCSIEGDDSLYWTTIAKKIEERWKADFKQKIENYEASL